MSLGRGITVSFWIGLISGMISAVWSFLYTKVINPESMEVAKRQLDEMRAQVEDGELPEWALSFTESAQSMGSNPLVGVIASIIIIVFIGFIISLFLKNDRPRA